MFYDFTGMYEQIEETIDEWVGSIIGMILSLRYFFTPASLSYPVPI